MGDIDIRIKPAALTAIVPTGAAATDPDHSATVLGGVFVDCDGKTYRYVSVDDANNVDPTVNDAMGYVSNDTLGYKVTGDISDSDAGLFAGRLNADTATASPTDDDEVFIQTRGIGTLAYEPTSDTTIDGGDSVIWDQDGVTDKLGAASNDVAAKCAEDITGLTTTTETTIEAYILGIV